MAPCPVHGGDNTTGLTLYIEGYSEPGRWKCNTAGCNSSFYSSILGFIRGVLSHKKYGWTCTTDKTVTFAETLEFAENFLGNIGVEIDEKEAEKKRFSNLTKVHQTTTKTPDGIPRHKVRQLLDIPSQYYIDRGVEPKLLDEYDIGQCNDRNKPMFNRAVIPVYDVTGRVMLGCTGRHINGGIPKWKHSYNFPSETVLYNFWKAKKSITKLHSVILVESPGNVLKLVQNGVYNVVGLFGTSLKKGQERLLQTLPLYTVNLLLDNGPAGLEGTKVLQHKLQKIYDVNVITFEDYEDVDEMPNNLVQRIIVPQIRNYLI